MCFFGRQLVLCLSMWTIVQHSNVFFGVTVGTVCYLSMWTMVQPVSRMLI